MRNGKTCTLILSMLWFLVSCFAALAQNPFAFETTDRVNLRTGAGTQFEVIDTVPAGTAMIELERRLDWSRVIVAGVSDFEDQLIRNGYLDVWVSNSFIKTLERSSVEDLVTDTVFVPDPQPQDRAFYCAAMQSGQPSGNVVILSPLEPTHDLDRIVAEDEFHYQFELHSFGSISRTDLARVDPRTLRQNADTLIFTTEMSLVKFANIIRFSPGAPDSLVTGFPWGIFRLAGKGGVVNFSGDFFDNDGLEEVDCSFWRNFPSFTWFPADQTDYYLLCHIPIGTDPEPRVFALSSDLNLLQLPAFFRYEFGDESPRITSEIFDAIDFASATYDDVQSADPSGRPIVGRLTAGIGGVVFAVQMNGVGYTLGETAPLSLRTQVGTFPGGTTWPCRLLLPNA